MVVAESRYLAEDAVEHDRGRVGAAAGHRRLHARPPSPGSPLVHDDVPDNVAARFTQVVGDPDAAFAQAAHVFRERLHVERSCGSPIEARGVVAVYDRRQGSLQVWDSTQAPLTIKNGLAAHARPAGAQGRGDRAGRRRRLRHQDPDVLPGGGAGPLGRDAARPARQVDRGPPRALHLGQPGARPAPRDRGRRRRRRPHPRPRATASSTTPAPTPRTAWSRRSSRPPSCPARTRCRTTAPRSPSSTPTPSR